MPVTYDIDGTEEVTKAIVALLNEYPRLGDGETISFTSLSEDGGISMFPTSGAVIEQDKVDVLGNHEQICQYPFYIFYRANGLSEGRKVSVKEWLDDLGRWLEKQPIVVGNVTSQLESYPALSGHRSFLSIQRTSPASLDSLGENQSENWVIRLTARYKNDF